MYDYKIYPNSPRSDVIPICRVPLITSPREEQALISANNMKVGIITPSRQPCFDKCATTNALENILDIPSY